MTTTMTEKLEIPPLPASAIYQVEVGSTAHGTGIDGGEDHDEIVVTVETPEEVFSVFSLDGLAAVQHRTQPEGVRSGPGDTDRSVYSLRRFLKLAVAGNPSILMVFWAPVIRSASEGLELQLMSGHFIGKHIIPRYRGYMQAQGMRLLGLRGSGHGRRGGGRREELIEAHGYDTKFAMHASRLGFQCLELLDTGELQLPIQGEPLEWLRAVRYGQVPFDEWWKRTLSLDAEMEKRLDAKGLPDGPNVDLIQHFSAQIHQRVWQHGVGPLLHA